MPKERSIAKRLSGGEALTSLCFQVRAKLVSRQPFQRDPAALDRLMKSIWDRLCRHEDFYGHRGYHGYAATIHIGSAEGSASVKVSFRPAMSYGRPPLNDEFMVPTTLSFEPVTVEIPVRPPNAVREEAEMPMPVAVEQDGQVVEKMVPASRYKGKLKPGTKLPQTASMEAPALKGRLEMPEGAVEQYGIQARG